MIAKAMAGWRPAGLLRYLFGPGKHEEHRDPRVVASWDGAPWRHQPEQLPSASLDGEVVTAGAVDLDLRPLTATMQELAEAAGLPTANPPALTAEWEDHLRAGAELPASAPEGARHYYRYDRRRDAVVASRGYVWHCPVRLHPEDPVLTDAQWETIAQRLMEATGIHQAGCRWIAVRHADDHVHLVATLVSELTGRRFYPRFDKQKLAVERAKLEEEFGLVRTSPVDKTATRTPSRAELGKAQRFGRGSTAREQLRRSVTMAAAAADGPAAFFARLEAEGVRVFRSFTAEGVLRGYSVAMPGDVSASGTPVAFAGSTLAADLSWPKLLRRWEDCGAPDESWPVGPEPGEVAGVRSTPAQRRAVLDDATAVVELATRTVREGDRGGGRGGESVAGIAHAAGEVLTVLARGREGHDVGALAVVADRYDRAAREPYRVVPPRLGVVARELRQASRRVAAVGALTGRGDEKQALLALVLALAGLVAEIAAWQQTRRRTHQAVAARSAAHGLQRAGRSGGRERSGLPPRAPAPSEARGGGGGPPPPTKPPPPPPPPTPGLRVPAAPSTARAGAVRGGAGVAVSRWGGSACAAR